MSVFADFMKDNFRRVKLPSEKHRIEFIDLAKGCCILIVVFLHADYSSILLCPLYLPLFFTLSGLFFKDYDGIFDFLAKKVRQLVIPFLLFFVIGILLKICTDRDASLLDLLRQPFVESSIQNEPIWFLICLFWVNLLYYFMSTFVKGDLYRLIACVAMGVIGMMLDYYSIYLPLFLGSAFSATPFFFVGIMLRKTPLLYKTHHDGIILFMAVVVLVAVCAYCVMAYTPTIIFKDNSYTGTYPEVLLVSVLMVVCFLILCKAVKWLPVISYFGRFSIIVLCVHDLFLGYAYLPVHWLTGHTFSQLELLVMTLLLSWISIPFFHKFLRAITSK